MAKFKRLNFPDSLRFDFCNSLITIWFEIRVISGFPVVDFGAFCNKIIDRKPLRTLRQFFTVFYGWLQNGTNKLLRHCQEVDARAVELSFDGGFHERKAFFISCLAYGDKA